MTRYEQLEAAFRAHGINDDAVLESHVRGCDLTREVRIATLASGSRFEVWVRDGGVPGKYAAPPGENPLQLGIMIERRHREVFAVRQALDITVCTAATFPAGLVEQVGGQGGGMQYILPPKWLERVERIR